MFNNFSTLADLIEVNPKKASEYLMNLSKVYRYTLTHLESDTVTVQNAIKHNEHTSTHPLTIEISGDEGQITVCNNKRMVSATDSAHVGNHNIEERYRLLTNKKVIIDSIDDFYSITIPIISQKALKK